MSHGSSQPMVWQGKRDDPCVTWRDDSSVTVGDDPFVALCIAAMTGPREPIRLV
jgi:hypothetical protein